MNFLNLFMFSVLVFGCSTVSYNSHRDSYKNNVENRSQLKRKLLEQREYGSNHSRTESGSLSTW